MSSNTIFQTEFDLCSQHVDTPLMRLWTLISLDLLSISDNPQTFGEHVKVSLLSTEIIRIHTDWEKYVMYNGQERACFSKFSPVHRVLIEFEMPTAQVLLRSESAFTIIINKLGNDRYRKVDWNNMLSEHDKSQLDSEVSMGDCLDSYNGIFDIDLMRRSGLCETNHDIQGCLQGVPLRYIRSAQHVLMVPFWG